MKNYFKHNQEQIEAANRFLSEHSIWDMRFFNYDGWKLVLAGSQDFCYYHNIELVFEDVSFMSSVFEWSTPDVGPFFEILASEELLNFEKKYDMKNDGQVFKINTGDNDIEHYVVAGEVNFIAGMVFYYPRENLNEGERIILPENSKIKDSNSGE